MDTLSLLIGAGSAPLAQVTKADGWSRWVQVAYAVAIAFVGAGAANGGLDAEKGLTAALAALATHSALLADTPVGKAMKWDLLGKVLGGLGEVFKGMAGKAPPVP